MVQYERLRPIQPQPGSGTIVTTENVTLDGEKRLKELLQERSPMEIKENKKSYDRKVPLKGGKRIDDEPAGKKMMKENKEDGKKEDEKD